jgi:hypothetical protein
MSSGLVQVDEERTVKQVWTYSGQSTLAQDLASIGDTVYVHDTTTVWAYSPETGEADIVWQHADADIRWIDDAGDHLVAWVWSPDGEELIEMKPKSGKTKVLWRTYLDSGTYSTWDVGPDAVYLTSNELQSILRVPVE